MGKLIHLSQIKDGMLLKQNVTSLLESYEASKVLTSITKDGEAGYYNVDELLNALKTTVDEQLGDGEGSIDERIAAVKEELEGLIDDINEKEVSDYVKVRANLTHDQTVEGINLEWVLPGEGLNLEDYVPELDDTQEYLVYKSDNKPVRGADGSQVTYNFATGTFSDLPHKRVVAGEGSENLEISFELIEEPVEIKMFPVATFKFGELPKDFLLDNKEIKVMSYSLVIDDIIVGVASNTELIAEVKEKLTDEVIKQAIDGLKEELEGMIETEKERIDALLADDETEGSIAYLLKELRDEISERTGIVDGEIERIDGRIDELEQSVGEDLTSAIEDVQADLAAKYVELYNKNEDRKYEIKKLGAVTEVREKMTATEDQTEFALQFLPAKDTKVDMFVNGVKYTEDNDYEIEGQEAEWTFTSGNNGFDLEEGFKIEFAYKMKKAVDPAEHITIEDITEEEPDTPEEPGEGED